jgi:DMSO/TMAO reductase YedYZ molybdopterin-dependent catalytic subunit
MPMPVNNDDPLRPHSHDPNPESPTADPTFHLTLPDGTETAVAVSDLRALPATAVANCYIVSTGHGSSGPFIFAGVTLIDFIHAYLGSIDNWSQVEVISADGFGTRLTAAELLRPDAAGPPLLSYEVDDQPLTRQQGLVRLIVPNERDDALRQVKWVERVNVRR